MSLLRDWTGTIIRVETIHAKIPMERSVLFGRGMLVTMYRPLLDTPRAYRPLFVIVCSFLSHTIPLCRNERLVVELGVLN